MKPTGQLKHSFNIVRSLAFYFTKRFLKDKVALFFTFVFPLVFLFVFGALSSSGSGPTFTVALINHSETKFARNFVSSISQGQQGGVLEIEETKDFKAAEEQLGRGEIDAIFELPEAFGRENANGQAAGTLVSYFDEADRQLSQALTAIAQATIDVLNKELAQQDQPFKLENRSLQTANLSQFDYTFAGLLGFAILSLGIFGMANGFASDKKIGAYRRMRVAPIKAWHIIVATGITYTLVGVATVVMMFAVATLLLDFEMRGSIVAFLLFAALGVVCMYGFGIAVAGWARNENQAAPVAQLVAFPMMFLSGVFFPRFLMPDWLQSITAFVPLSPIVDGLRRITTENASLLQLGPELMVITAWTIAIYFLAFRSFRWE